MEIDTDRLVLRPLPAGVAAVILDDREGAALILGAGVHPGWPDGPVRGLMAIQARLSEDLEPFRVWVMIEREADLVVGDIGFKGAPDEKGVLEVGYSVVAEKRGRGLASEAARAIVAWALDRDDVSAVVASCDASNAASIGTLENAGFVRSGESGGEIHWRRTRSDP